MARVAAGGITLIDVTDGTNPIAVGLTNENHSFVATEAGVVQNRTGFSTELRVFVGGTAATYNVAGTTTANTFRITGVAYQGTSTGWTAPAFSSSGVVTIPGISNTATPSVIVRITYRVTNENGIQLAAETIDASLNVVRQGAGGLIIALAATDQFFFSDNAGSLDTGQDDIILSISSQGSVGNYQFAISQNGGAFVTRTATGTGVGQISAYDADTTGDVETTGNFPNQPARIAISSANLGTNDTMAIRVTGANGGTDTVTIGKVRRGATGAAAIIVDVNSNNDDVFRVGSTNAAKTLSVTVYDAADGSVIDASNITNYRWTRSGSGSVSAGNVRVTSSTNRAVVASGGVEANGSSFTTIIVGDEDVSDRETFNCIVTTSS